MDFSKIRTYVFIALLIGATILFLLLLKPFAYAIFWAAVIAALVHPLHKRIQKYIHSPNFSAAITLLIVTVVIVLPAIILGMLMFNEAVDLYDKVRTNQDFIVNYVDQTFTALKNNSALARLNLDTGFINNQIKEWGSDLTPRLAKIISDFTQNSFIFLAMFIIMMYTLFFFIRDGERMLRKLMYLSPLDNKFENIMYKKFTVTANATIKGTLIVGLIQGALGGIMFAIAGIDGALIWAVIMALLSIIPGIGSAIVWFPAALILIFTGQVWQGIMILIVGALIIGTIDNLLRPILVGKDIEMHELIIFFSTLGGIAIFGFSGFMIGPLIAALLFSFWKIYENYFSQDLANNFEEGN
jgi:predicted PurR-regulated permease PerM